MDNSLRYLATVLRAIFIPCRLNRLAISVSLKGCLFVSSAINFLMIAFIAVDEHSPPYIGWYTA